MKENEFQGHTLENLGIMEIALEAYKQGALDTINVMKEHLDTVGYKTLTLYNEKLALCRNEINKLKESQE